MTEISTAHHKKISELIVDLFAAWQEHGNISVVMSKDAEGNTYSPLSDSDVCLYVMDSTWSGEVHDLDPDEDDEWGVSEDDENVIKALVIWPVN